MAIGACSTHEASLLLPPPDTAFETRLVPTPRVDRYGMITVRVCRYPTEALDQARAERRAT
ncbi:hypothetical protein GCM10022233_73550 [Streptomyces shaanxiensis]|uniref:Uncharacterized protein n=1 Tax=Streptomyces shaanxiensis TaxID=653357 RepID=A0ABP7W6W4_9ACTN